MKQQSPEWFEARKGMITGSRVAAALGISPWQTPEELIRAMVREYHGAPSEFNGGPHIEYGTLHEPIAMLDFMLETGEVVEEGGFFVHPGLPLLGASPDGLLKGGGVLEIKCPYGLRHRPEPDFKSIFTMPHYYAQVQIEMACAGRSYAAFYQWSQFGHKLEYVPFCKKWLGDNLPKIKDFHDHYLSERDNPAHLEPLRPAIQSEEIEDLVRFYKEVCADINNLEATKKETLEKIVQLAGEKDAEINGHKLTRVVREGSISYAKALKKYAPDADLEPFRGKPSEYWKLT